MAESEGFEPSVHIATDTCLAGKPIRPLWQLSISDYNGTAKKNKPLVVFKFQFLKMQHVNKQFVLHLRNHYFLKIGIALINLSNF